MIVAATTPPFYGLLNAPLSQMPEAFSDAIELHRVKTSRNGVWCEG